MSALEFNNTAVLSAHHMVPARADLHCAEHQVLNVKPERRVTYWKHMPQA